jgi:hypothetical protein
MKLGMKLGMGANLLLLSGMMVAQIPTHSSQSWCVPQTAQRSTGA